MGAEGKVRGRPFLPGNPGGPGRPKRELEREYLSVVMRLCPPSSWARIVERAVTDATAGDSKAREWLARYLLPAAPIDQFLELPGPKSGQAPEDNS